MKDLAQQIIIQPTNVPGIPGVSPITIKGPLVGIGNIGELVNTLVTFLIPIAGVVLFAILMWGGYDFLMSGGEPDKVKSGRDKITAGIIGFVLLVLSYLIVKLLAYIFNVGGGLF